MAFEELDPVFRELRAEWAQNSAYNAVPLRRFLMYAFAPDYYHLKFLVTDYHSNTFESLKSIEQLEDLRDNIGIGGSWSDFVEYLMVSIKSEYMKLILEKHVELKGTIFAKLVAQKSKGMPLISIPLSKLVDSAANDAMENMSFGLFRSFETLIRLDGTLHSSKGFSVTKPESPKNQIETNPVSARTGSFSQGSAVVNSQGSPGTHVESVALQNDADRCRSTATKMMSKRERETRPLLIGASQFEDIINEDARIVDKTMFIMDFMEDGSKVNVILRPRRFGKTTNLTMLRSFLSLGAKPGAFDRYLIGEEKEFVQNHCGRYPVVYISLKDCRGDSWEKMCIRIWACIRRTASLHKKDLTPEGISLFKLDEILLPYVPKEESYMIHMLQELTEILYKKNGKKVIVLVDEYDTPLNHAFLKNYYAQASEFFGAFYSCALKDNIALEKACLMGIVEMRGAGMLSGLNNSVIRSVADEEYSAAFGFSREEVENFLGDEGRVRDVLESYNGYNMHSHLVINPWSFVNYVASNKLKSYWVDSSFTESFSKFLEPCLSIFLMDAFCLLYDKDTEVHVAQLDTKVNYTATEWNRDSLLHFLVHTGYLTCRDEGDGKRRVWIPNKEIREHWSSEISKLLKASFVPHFQDRVHDAFDAVPFDVVQLQNLMEKMIEFCSFHDLSKENSYHLLYYGSFLAVLHDSNKVEVISNQGLRGHGRFDICVQFHGLQRVFILEFKKSTCEENLVNDAKFALAKIKGEHYAAKYADNECILIGVSFWKKMMSTLEHVICKTAER